MKIYTRTGDAGQTGLLGGDRVSKSSLRVDAYGEVDELSSTLGVAQVEASDLEIQRVLEDVQRDLFSLGALLADPKGTLSNGRASLEGSAVRRLEEHIDRFDSRLPALTRFVLPGGSRGGATLHHARSVCRRAERKLVALTEAEEVPVAAVPYLNRLSDLLFVMARLENQHRGMEDKVW